MKIRFLKLMLIAAAIALPGFAHAAGLGKLTVKSALGEPLSGEIELVNVQAEELGTLTIKMASREAFSQARMDYLGALASVRFAVEMRPDGTPVIRVTSTQPMNEPFVDMLVELTWSSGKLLREYTFLLDPPEVARPMAAPAEPKPTPPAMAAPPAAAPMEAKPSAAPPPPAPRPMLSAAKGAESYGPVKYGDSLSKIALRIRPEGVNLDQMLVALYRANPQAFMGKNMNRLKTGPILRIPDAAEMHSLDTGDAKKEVKAQAADWNAYKQKLAAAAPTIAAGEEPKQMAGGKVTTRVEEQGEAAREQPKEVLKLSKGEPPAGAADARSLDARVKALQEENVAKEKALEEANERVALLEKNIREMQKLLEMKGAVPAAPPGAPSAAPESAPATAPSAAPAGESKPAVEVAKPETPKPAAPKPKPAPPPAAPSFLEELMDNPIFLAAGGLAVVLLGAGGYLAYRRRAGAGEVKVEELFTAMPPAGEAPAMRGEAEKQAAPAEEVDPLAEAEVYLAYGRDGQAEEILKEALGRDRNRTDVHLKLLEIYSRRKDRKAFEQTARTLQGLGVGSAAWETVQAMGLGIDPENPLYGGQPAAAVTTTVTERVEPGRSEVDFDLSAMEEAPPQPGTVSAERQASADTGLDFDLGALDAESSTPGGVEKVVPPEQVSVFDITAPPSEEKPVPQQQKTWPSKPDASLPNIDLELGAESSATPSVAHDAQWQEVATKFDLAKVYKEMGDKDGAREILQEVVRDGDAQQKEDAKALLASL